MNMSGPRDILAHAVLVFDAAEALIRQRCCRLRDNGAFYGVVYTVAFMVVVRFLVPALPAAWQPRLMFGISLLFFAGLLAFPAMEYWLPQAVELSYLFRKERFIHAVIDRYGLNIPKHPLTGQPVTTTLFGRWGKVNVSNAAVAAIFTPAIWLFTRRTEDPLQALEVIYAREIS